LDKIVNKDYPTTVTVLQQPFARRSLQPSYTFDDMLGIMNNKQAEFDDFPVVSTEAFLHRAASIELLDQVAGLSTEDDEEQNNIVEAFAKGLRNMRSSKKLNHTTQLEYEFQRLRVGSEEARDELPIQSTLEYQTDASNEISDKTFTTAATSNSKNNNDSNSVNKTLDMPQLALDTSMTEDELHFFRSSMATSRISRTPPPTSDEHSYHLTSIASNTTSESKQPSNNNINNSLTQLDNSSIKTTSESGIHMSENAPQKHQPGHFWTKDDRLDRFDVMGQELQGLKAQLRSSTSMIDELNTELSTAHLHIKELERRDMGKF
jgi:hypothetical protein